MAVRPLCAAIAGTLLFAQSALAHQPVMDMAPRWSGGFGIQVRQEYRATDDVLQGSSDVHGTPSRSRRVRTTWLEGVYTFDREQRITLKVPWVDQRREVVQGAAVRSETGSGFGDPILGLPIKRYYNDSEGTGNFGITPSVRIPIGSTGGDYPVADGSWDFGLSASYSASTRTVYQLYDLFYWSNGSGRNGINRGDEVGFDMNLGLHFYHDNSTNSGAFLMLDVAARYQGRGHDTGGTTGGKRISTGPVLVIYRDNVMLRGEFSIPVYESVRGTQFSRGTGFNLGIGAAF